MKGWFGEIMNRHITHFTSIPSPTMTTPRIPDPTVHTFWACGDKIEAHLSDENAHPSGDEYNVSESAGYAAFIGADTGDSKYLDWIHTNRSELDPNLVVGTLAPMYVDAVYHSPIHVEDLPKPSPDEWASSCATTSRMASAAPSSLATVTEVTLDEPRHADVPVSPVSCEDHVTESPDLARASVANFMSRNTWSRRTVAQQRALLSDHSPLYLTAARHNHPSGHGGTPPTTSSDITAATQPCDDVSVTTVSNRLDEYMMRFDSETRFETTRQARVVMLGIHANQRGIPGTGITDTAARAADVYRSHRGKTSLNELDDIVRVLTDDTKYDIIIPVLIESDIAGFITGEVSSSLGAFQIDKGETNSDILEAAIDDILTNYAYHCGGHITNLVNSATIMYNNARDEFANQTQQCLPATTSIMRHEYETLLVHLASGGMIGYVDTMAMQTEIDGTFGLDEPHEIMKGVDVILTKMGRDVCYTPVIAAATTSATGNHDTTDANQLEFGMIDQQEDNSAPGNTLVLSDVTDSRANDSSDTDSTVTASTETVTIPISGANGESDGGSGDDSGTHSPPPLVPASEICLVGGGSGNGDACNRRNGIASLIAFSRGDTTVVHARTQQIIQQIEDEIRRRQESNTGGAADPISPPVMCVEILAGLNGLALNSADNVLFYSGFVARSLTGPGDWQRGAIASIHASMLEYYREDMRRACIDGMRSLAEADAALTQLRTLTSRGGTGDGGAELREIHRLRQEGVTRLLSCGVLTYDKAMHFLDEIRQSVYTIPAMTVKQSIRFAMRTQEEVRKAINRKENKNIRKFVRSVPAIEPCTQPVATFTQHDCDISTCDATNPRLTTEEFERMTRVMAGVVNDTSHILHTVILLRAVYVKCAWYVLPGHNVHESMLQCKYFPVVSPGKSINGLAVDPDTRMISNMDTYLDDMLRCCSHGKDDLEIYKRMRPADVALAQPIWAAVQPAVHRSRINASLPGERMHMRNVGRSTIDVSDLAEGMSRSDHPHPAAGHIDIVFPPNPDTPNRYDRCRTGDAYPAPLISFNKTDRVLSIAYTGPSASLQ